MTQSGTTAPVTTPAPSRPAVDLTGLNPYIRVLARVELRRTDAVALRLLVAPVLTVEGFEASEPGAAA